MIANGSKTKIKFSKAKEKRDGTFLQPIELKCDSPWKLKTIKNNLMETVDSLNGIHKRGRSKKLKVIY